MLMITKSDGVGLRRSPTRKVVRLAEVWYYPYIYEVVERISDCLMGIYLQEERKETLEALTSLTI